MICVKRTLYLLRLEVNGIKNIESPIELSFYRKIIENDFDPSQYRVKAIFGENGSGKTAIIVALKILQNILLDDSYLYDNDTQKVLIETVNKHKRAGYIECEYIYGEKGHYHICNYHIDFAVKDDRKFIIVGECFKTKNGNHSKNSYKTYFETRNGELIVFGNGKNIDHYRKITQNLLEHRGLLTWLQDDKFFNVDMFRKDKSFTCMFFLLLFAFSLNVYLDEDDNHHNYFLKRSIEEFDSEDDSNESIAYIKHVHERLINSFVDTNYVKKDGYLKFRDYVKRMYYFIRIFKSDLRGIEVEKKEMPDYYKCDLIMVYDHYQINQELESRGIKKLIKLFRYLDGASRGMITFIDELDSNINDIYLDKLIEYFMYYSEGQLCFTSHNLSPMNILNNNKCSISFISSVNTVHSWTKNGNESPENAYRKGFIEDSPFNVDATDFIGILGGTNEQADSDMRGDE